MTDAEQIWTLKRELAQTKLALYGAQNSFLQLAAEKVQAELAALGDKWIDPDAPPA